MKKSEIREMIKEEMLKEGDDNATGLYLVNLQLSLLKKNVAKLKKAVSKGDRVITAKDIEIKSIKENAEKLLKSLSDGAYW